MLRTTVLTDSDDDDTSIKSLEQTTEICAHSKKEGNIYQQNCNSTRQ